MLPTPLARWSLLFSITPRTRSLNSFSSTGILVLPCLIAVRSSTPKTSSRSAGTASRPTQMNWFTPSSIKYNPYGTTRSEERLQGGGRMISPVAGSGTPELSGMSCSEKNFGYIYWIIRGNGRVERRQSAAERKSEGIWADFRRPT